MANIKQKLQKYILSFLLCITFSGCGHKEQSIHKVSEPVVEIATLFPMTGENGQLGQECASLTRLGMMDTVNGNVHLTSYDGSNENAALASMEKIVKRNTKIILGPMYSPITSAILDIAKKHGIVVLTLSNNPALASKNEVYVFGHAPLKQLEIILRHTIDKGHTNLITLLPESPNTHTTNKIIQEIAVSNNAILVDKAQYQNTPESINAVVSRVSEKVDSLNEEDEAKPVIYIADDSQNLPLLFSAIHKHNLDKKALIIGDHRIDTNTPEHITMLFPGSLNILNYDLSNAISNNVSFMHILSFDLGRMVGSLIHGNFSNEIFTDKLNNMTPYIGASGKITFLDGIAQRKYDIIKFDNGRYSTVNQ